MTCCVRASPSSGDALPGRSPTFPWASPASTSTSTSSPWPSRAAYPRSPQGASSTTRCCASCAIASPTPRRCIDSDAERRACSSSRERPRRDGASRSRGGTGRVEKIYRALVTGVPSPSAFSVDIAHRPDPPSAVGSSLRSVTRRQARPHSCPRHSRSSIGRRDRRSHHTDRPASSDTDPHGRGGAHSRG